MEGSVSFRHYSSDDAAVIVAGMRSADREECIAVLGRMPDAASLDRMARRSFNMTTAEVDGVPAAIYGVNRVCILSFSGIPWLLGTDDILKPHAMRALIEHGRRELLRIAADFSDLSNTVSSRNRRAIRWLEYVGFTVDRHSPIVVRGVTFFPFKMEA